MALVARPTWEVTFTIVDLDNEKSTMTKYVDAGIDMAQLILAINTTMIPRIAELTNGKIIKWSASVTAEEDYENWIAPTEASDVQRKGVFSFAAANNQTYTVSLPSISNQYVVDNTDGVIDRSNAQVQAFVNMFVDNGVLGLFQPRTYLGADLKRLTEAVKKHRKSKAG